MLNTKSALPHSENNTHLNMEATYDGKSIFQFDEECPICTEKYFEKAVINSCQHVFCCNCVLTWAEQENSCPLCKTKFTILQKKVRIMEKGALVEQKVVAKRIAHKKQRPPEMTLAEFEQFQYDMEIEELDEWIIDDEVYSEAMDVAPIDHLEVLEQSIAEMTRHSHRERRHHRDNTHTAHRKTKRRKPQSIAVREDIGPVRTRYTRHHQNNNNNNNTNETSTQLVDIVDEVDESTEPKYNLRKRKAPKAHTDFIELANEDEGEMEQKEPETVPPLLVVNDGCHIDRRTLIASPTKIVKATEVNLPVDMFSDKPGDHDNHDGLSEDEVTEDGGTCVEQIFLGDMDTNFVQSAMEDPHKKRDGSRKREANDAHPEFTLGAIPFIDEETDKVMPIEGATGLSSTSSVNNVSINNTVPTDPEPAVDSASTRGPSTESTQALKPPSKPQPPFPSAKKTPVLVKPLVDTADEAQSPVKAATPVKPSRGRRRAKPLTPVEPTQIQSLPSPQPLPSHTVESTTSAPITSPSKPDIDTMSVPKPSSKSPAPTPSPSKPADTTALKPPSKPQPPTPAVRKTSAAAKYLTAPATEKPPSKKTMIKELKSPSNVEPLVSSAKAQILNKITKTQPVPQSEGPTEESIVESKATENGDGQTTGTPPKRKTLAGRKGKEKRTALSAKLASNRPQPSQVQSPNDKKTTANLIVNDSSQNVMQTNVIDVQKLKNVSFKKKPTTVPSEPVPQPTEQPADSTTANNNNSLTTASNVANDPTVESKASDQSAVVTKAEVEATSSTTDKPTDNVSTAEPVTKSILDERVGNLLDRIAPIYTMDVGGYQQHGSNGTTDDIDFSDSAFPTEPESSQHQHIDDSEQDNRDEYYDQDYHSYDDNGGYHNDSQYQSNYDERQSRHKRYERCSNSSTANGYNGYHQYREGSYDRQYHNGRYNYTRGGRYDDNIRPANSFNNRRGNYQNGYRGYNMPYDHRPSHSNYYQRQHYDNRAVQQTVPVQVVQQQVVQQVVSVQQVPSVPTTTAAVMTAPKIEPREEPKTDGDCFYNRGKRKQKTPEPETDSVARVEPMPMSVPRPSVIKTEVTSVVIKTEVVSAPILPDPVRVPQALPLPPVSPPTITPAAVVHEPDVSAQPLPRTDVSSQSAVSASKKRSRSRSPSNDREHKRRKVLHDVLDKRRDKDRYSYKEKEKDKHKDKYRDKEKEKHKDKHRSKDKDKRRDKDKHRDKDKKDKHERHKDKSYRDKDKEDQRDKEESKKTDNDKPNSVSRDNEQLEQSTSDPKPVVEPSVVPVSLAKKALKSVIMLSDGTKISPAKSTVVARKNGETSATPIKKKRLVSKVSVPQQ